MEPKYTARKIEGTNTGWEVTENETGRKSIVFCNANANTAEDAVAVLEALSEKDEKPSESPKN